jgi:hypothetical protein
MAHRADDIHQDIKDARQDIVDTRSAMTEKLNRTTGHWYSVKLCENTLAVRSKRSRASGEVEEQAEREAGGLRLRSAPLRPTGTGSTASEEVYESSVV